MRYCLVFAIALSTSVLLAADKKTEIVLPKDGTEAVITMDYVGGFRADPKVTFGDDGRAHIEEPKPFLVIQADGTVLKQGKAIAKKMTADELKELLTFVVVENHFFDFDKAAVEAAIQKDKEKLRKKQEAQIKAEGVAEVRILPDDMATTTITVELGDRRKTVECYGYSFLASWHKEIAAIQAMHRIEQKLTSVAQ